LSLRFVFFKVLLVLPKLLHKNAEFLSIQVLLVLHDNYMYLIECRQRSAGRQFYVCSQFMAVTIASAN
jgi:hypothetical protein